MTKIKIDRNRDGSYQQPFSGKGLRCNQSGAREDIAPVSQRERDECFDMYRNDGRTRMSAKGNASVRKTVVKSGGGGFQLWQIACLISALGAFCLFADSICINITGIPVRMMSFEMLYGGGSLSEDLPACATYMSAMPLVFIVLFGVFAYMKETAFEKAYLALIAVSVFVTVMLVYWSGQVANYSQEFLLSFSPGYAVIIEIGCSIALALVVVCQKLLGYMGSRTPSSVGWTR